MHEWKYKLFNSIYFCLSQSAFLHNTQYGPVETGTNTEKCIPKQRQAKACAVKDQCCTCVDIVQQIVLGEATNAGCRQGCVSYNCSRGCPCRRNVGGSLQMTINFYYVKIKCTLMVQTQKYSKFSRRENYAGYSIWRDYLIMSLLGKKLGIPQ